ncbi:MAG TPA: hypothetical protein PKY82_29490, partial [Pyrinomonadaceae bacterium]|nr:hypothetical protein [Pyrinomonadaceae bacterium]
MSSFDWTEKIEAVSPAALTVLAQAVSPNDNGKLKWDVFFPRTNVDSVDLEDVTTIDYRPVSDRREWNQRGRLIPTKAPDKRKVSIVPVEGYFHWGEKELQKLKERVMGNADLLAKIMMSSVPDKVKAIAMANYRRLEVDAFTAWALGTITQRNPQNAAETYAASFGFDSSRYQTAGTAWNDSGLNCYDEFLDWLDDAIDAIGSVKGVVCRRNFIKEVLADAPDLAGGARMTMVQLEQRIQDDKGSEFRFYPMEDTVEVFTDGGTATTSTKVWAAQRVAAVPGGTVVGKSAFAPVVRA